MRNLGQAKVLPLTFLSQRAALLSDPLLSLSILIHCFAVAVFSLFFYFNYLCMFYSYWKYIFLLCNTFLLPFSRSLLISDVHPSISHRSIRSLFLPQKRACLQETTVKQDKTEYKVKSSHGD